MNEGRWYTFGLVSLFFVSLTMRLILPLEFNVWGPDTGENYYIAKYLALNGSMPLPYYGFGTTYTEFPTVYLLVSSIASICGVSTAASVELTMPFVASLLVFPIAGIASTLSGRRGAGLASALFYSTSTIIIGHTSIMASDTLGEVLIVFFLYFYISSKRDRMMTVASFATALAMIPTYHLGTVLLLLFLYAVLFYYSFYRREDGTELLKSLAFILSLTTLTWAYWIFQAPAFVSVFVLRNPHLSIGEAISASYLPAFILFIAGSYVHLKQRGRRKEAAGGYSWVRYAAASIIATAGVSLLAIFGAASVPLYPGWYTLLNIPTGASTMMGIAAFLPLIRKQPRAYPLAATMAGIVFIVLLGSATNIRFLVPERLVEYLLLFIAAFAGLGMVEAVESSGRRYRTAIALVLAVSLILAAGVSTSFVAATTTPSKIGATPARDVSAEQWLGLNTAAFSTVASDHRLSSLTFGFADRNATWEVGGYPIFTAVSLPALLASLNSSETPSGNKTIDFILVDTYMIQAANFYPNQTAIPVTGEVLVYMQGNDFVQVYSNGLASVYAYAP